MGSCLCYLEQMSAALMETGYDDNAYGAVTFREADSSAGTFDYTVHVGKNKNGGGGAGIVSCVSVIIVSSSLSLWLLRDFVAVGRCSDCFSCFWSRPSMYLFMMPTKRFLAV